MCSSLRTPLDVAAAVLLLLLVPSFHEKSSGLHGDLQLLRLVLGGVDPDLHPGIVLLLLVEQAPELLELVVEVPAGDHLVVVPSVAEEGIVKGAPHAEGREGVDVEGHLFFLVFGLAWIFSLRLWLLNSPC